MRSWVPALALCFTLAVPAAVHAQAEDARYRALIDEAVAEFGASRFPEARALFIRAHEISPNARTLRGIGMSSFEMRDYIEAYRALSAALEHPQRPLTAEQAEEVRGLLERTAAFVGRYRLSVTPASATVAVDGARPVTAADGRLLLAIGRHEIVARADGYEDARAAIEVRGGEENETVLTLEASSGGGGATAETASSSPPSTARATDRSESGSSSLPGILLVSGGAAAIGAGVVILLASWLPLEDEIDACLMPMSGVVCENRDELNGQRDVAAVSTIALGIVGAGALVAGAIWLATSDSSDESDGSLACAPTGAGVACVGAF